MLGRRSPGNADDELSALRSGLSSRPAAEEVWLGLDSETQESYVEWILGGTSTKKRNERRAELIRMLPNLPAVLRQGRAPDIAQGPLSVTIAVDAIASYVYKRHRPSGHPDRRSSPSGPPASSSPVAFGVDSYPTPSVRRSTVTYSAALQAVLDSVPAAPITTEDVSYTGGDTEIAGFVARPEGGGTRPGILIIHDWTGLNDHGRVRAQMLARLGYVALAGDVYGGGLNVGPDVAPKEAGRYYGDPPLFRDRMRANLDHLRSLPGVDPERIVVLGYCFGGSAALELARDGAEVAGFVSFHGNLATAAPAEPGSIHAPVLVLTGAADPVVPDEQVVAFENEMRAANAPDWQVVSYSGAMHAFTQPDANAPDHGAAYHPTANARSWTALRNFLDEVL